MPIHDVLAQSTVILAERHVLWPGHLGAANPRQGLGHQCEEFRDLEPGTNNERIDRLMQRGVVSDIRERHGRTIGRTDVTIVCRAVYEVSIIVSQYSFSEEFYRKSGRGGS